MQWLVIYAALFKLNDFSRLQAITYTAEVVLSQKWCKIETSLLHATGRKWYTSYQMSFGGNDWPACTFCALALTV